MTSIFDQFCSVIGNHKCIAEVCPCRLKPTACRFVFMVLRDANTDLTRTEIQY